MADGQIRYDSIWRRIKSDDYASKLEGQFRERRDRLGDLNNWGSLAWLYPHATATKLAHHYGVEHNALHFLDADEKQREKYRPSFRIASHVLHWGHIPLSYAGSEAIIRAAHVDSKVKKVLDGILREVVDFGQLTCTSDDHFESCLDPVLEGEQPFELYKWLSAWLLSKNWKQVWKTLKSVCSEDVTEDEVRKATFRTLVCKEDFGYQLLDHCRLADYVPRDLQQAGTAWLSVDIEALWEKSPLRPDRAQEWNLLEAARDYLEDRFFMSPDAQLVHSLASRAIAQGLLNKGVTRENLLLLLAANTGDAQYFSLFSEYHRRRLRTVEKWAKGGQLGRIWSHIGTFSRIRVPMATRLEVEDLLSKRTGEARLSYPLAGNHSVIVTPEAGGMPEPGPGDYQSVSVTLHHRHDGQLSTARPALDIALEVRRCQARFQPDDVAGGIASWFANERVDIRSRQVRRAAGRAMLKDELKVRTALDAVRKRAEFKREKDPGGRGRALSALLARSPMSALALGRRTLELPIGACRSKPGISLLEYLRSCGLQEAVHGPKLWRGPSLEAAVAADQLLSDEPCTQRFLILGATALSSEGVPVAEWDILRLDLLDGGDWRLVGVECSIAPNGKKETKDREKLERLRLALHKRFADLLEFKTRLAFIENGSLKLDDANRGIERT